MPKNIANGETSVSINTNSMCRNRSLRLGPRNLLHLHYHPTLLMTTRKDSTKSEKSSELNKRNSSSAYSIKDAKTMENKRLKKSGSRKFAKKKKLRKENYLLVLRNTCSSVKEQKSLRAQCWKSVCGPFLN